MLTAPAVELAELGGTWEVPEVTPCPETRPRILPLKELWDELGQGRPSPVPAPLVVTPLEPEVEMEVLPSTELLDWVVLLRPKPPDAAAWA